MAEKTSSCCADFARSLILGREHLKIDPPLIAKTGSQSRFRQIVQLKDEATPEVEPRIAD